MKYGRSKNRESESLQGKNELEVHIRCVEAVSERIIHFKHIYRTHTSVFQDKKNKNKNKKKLQVTDGL